MDIPMGTVEVEKSYTVKITDKKNNPIAVIDADIGSVMHNGLIDIRRCNKEIEVCLTKYNCNRNRFREFWDLLMA